MAPSKVTTSFFRTPLELQKARHPLNITYVHHFVIKIKSPQARPAFLVDSAGGPGSPGLGLRFTRASRAEQGRGGSETGPTRFSNSPPGHPALLVFRAPEPTPTAALGLPPPGPS